MKATRRKPLDPPISAPARTALTRAFVAAAVSVANRAPFAASQTGFLKATITANRLNPPAPSAFRRHQPINWYDMGAADAFGLAKSPDQTHTLLT